MTARLAPADLVRILGPGEPEVSCEECFEQLDVYVERALAGHDAAREFPRFAAHLRGCGACREEHDDLLELLRLQRR